MNNDTRNILRSLQNNPQMRKIMANAKASVLYGEVVGGQNVLGTQDADGQTGSTEFQATKNAASKGQMQSMGVKTPPANPFLGLLLHGITMIPSADDSLDDNITSILNKIKNDNRLKNLFTNIMFKQIPATAKLDLTSLGNARGQKDLGTDEQKAVDEVREASETGYDTFVDKNPDEIKKQLTTWVTTDSYGKEEIAMLMKIWGIETTEENMNRYTAFFSKLEKEMPDTGKVYLSLITEASKNMNLEQVDTFTIIKKLIAGGQHDKIIDICHAALKTVTPYIDTAIQHVQGELGAQIAKGGITGVAGSLGDDNSDKMKNKAVQDSYIYFILFTYIYTIAEVVTYEVSESIFKRSIERVLTDVYYEHQYSIAEGVIANTVTVMKNAKYVLGKRYKSFAEVIGTNPAALKPIITKITENKDILNATMSSLMSQGLFDSVNFDKFASADSMDKQINPSLIKQKLAPVTAKFSNKAELNNIVTKIFANAGIKKTIAAKIGGALGKAAGTLSNIKNGVPSKATPDEAPAQMTDVPDAAMKPVK